MDRVSLRYFDLHRAFALLLAVAGLGIAALAWGRVVQTIFTAKPVASTMQARSIVWGDFVFLSPTDLGRWLRSHGATYAVWRGRHSLASALLEHRPAPTVRPHPTVQPSNATSTTRTVTPTNRAQDTTATQHTTAPQRTTASQSPIAQPLSSGRSRVQRIFIALLALLAAACALAASLPRVIWNRYPNFAQRIAPYRVLLLASASALMIGIVAGAVLN
jgi:hypothetical protein